MFIFVTTQINEINKIIDNNFDKKIYQTIKVFKADREKIPFYLSSLDLMLCFIKKTFSRTAMSPTKMFESFAAGVPFVCNKGIGDVDSILNKYKTGALIEIKNINNTKKNLKLLQNCKTIKPSNIIKKTKSHYDIIFARARYNHVYNLLENEK